MCRPKCAEISYQEFIKLNPGYNRWATAPYRPYKLLIPVNKVESFNRNLALLPQDQRVSWMRHQVSAGDNLQIIAQRYHTTVNLIKELNQLKSNQVHQGQYVLVPQSPSKLQKAAPQALQHFKPLSSFKIVHIVEFNETYAKLSQQFQVSIQDIQHWNNLSPSSSLKPGQSLIIWKSAHPKSYKIRAGDSLSKIAHEHQTSVQALLSLNPTIKPSQLRLGQVLILG